MIPCKENGEDHKALVKKQGSDLRRFCFIEVAKRQPLLL